MHSRASVKLGKNCKKREICEKRKDLLVEGRQPLGIRVEIRGNISMRATIRLRDLIVEGRQPFEHLI